MKNDRQAEQKLQSETVKVQITDSTINKILMGALEAARLSYPLNKLQAQENQLSESLHLKDQYALVLDGLVRSLEHGKISQADIPAAFNGIMNTAKNKIGSPTGTFNSGAYPAERTEAAAIIISITEIQTLCVTGPRLARQILHSYDEHTSSTLESELTPAIEVKIKQSFQHDFDKAILDRDNQIADLMERNHQMELELTRLREVEKSGKKIEELARQSMAVTEDLRKSIAAGGFSLGGNDGLPKKRPVQRLAVLIKGADSLPVDKALNGMFSTARSQVIGYLATLLADGNDHIAPFYGKIVSNPETVMSQLELDGVKKYLPSDKADTVMGLISSEETRSITARRANVESKKGDGAYPNYVAIKMAEYAEKKDITAKLAANTETNNTPH